MSVDPTLQTTEISAAANTTAPAKGWLELIRKAQTKFERWMEVAERVNDLYGDLEKLAGSGGDREFRLFWANLEVLRPSIYSRAPIPVVAPRFNDRKVIQRRAAEILERALITLTVESDMHDVLKLVRDDLARVGRGIPWVRINESGEVEFEHIEHDDWLVDPDARKWAEVKWVARRVFMDRERVAAMFPKADLTEVGFKDGVNDEIKAETQVEIWEIWHRIEKKVVHVAERFNGVLKEAKPAIDLKGFFPCPQPAHSTLQPGSLIPIPDYVYYRDQLDEINALTKRISVLTELIKLKGFYDAGGDADAKAAIEAAFKARSDDALLVGVKGLASLTTSSSGGLIEWFPTDKAANTVQVLTALRRQLIDDVYQITGLSDIMRGSTVASETLGAQQLKAQYGSVRIRERQEEMVRVARDLYRIAVEMLAEKVKFQTLLELAQVDDLPGKSDIANQVKQIEDEAQQQAAQAMQQAAQSGQPIDPEQAHQAASAVQAQIEGLQGQVTSEDVEKLLKDDRARAFALDVETDSTIQPDEDAEKQRRTEFLTAIGSAIGNLTGLVQTFPEAGQFAADIIRFTANGFRAGRELDQSIDEFAEKIAARANQPQGPSPEQQAAQAEQQVKQAEMQIKQQEAQRGDAVAQADVALKQAQAAKTQAEGQVIALDLQMKGQALADKQFNDAMTHHANEQFNAAVTSA